MHTVKRILVCTGLIFSCLRAGSLAGQPASPAPLDIANSPAGPALVFDSETKQYDASPGEAVAPFVFKLKNAGTNEIVIEQVKASCGCTTASMPTIPWHVPPGGGGDVHAQINLAGKMGLVTKTLTFYTSIGIRVVNLKVNIPMSPAQSGNLSAADRKAAMLRAAADSRAIFQGDCVKCHVDKGREAFGEDLYAADCGICHESSHRASVVPDLHALKNPTDLGYWKVIITLGKPHSMMPGFGAAEGGPLSIEQINSLATYLDRTISHHLTSAVAGATTAPTTSQ
jgi:mono/diheme cytochrome c family protein